MAEAKELTFQEVSSHNTKQDLYLIIHDKIYDCSSFVNEHPGGEEVLLDVGGQEATEAFEDVGHSDEARELLDGMFVGNLKRMPSDPEPNSGHGASSGGGSGGDSGVGVGMYAVILIGGAIAYGAYQYLQANAAANGEGQQ